MESNKQEESKNGTDEQNQPKNSTTEENKPKDETDEQKEQKNSTTEENKPKDEATKQKDPKDEASKQKKWKDEPIKVQAKRLFKFAMDQMYTQTKNLLEMASGLEIEGFESKNFENEIENAKIIDFIWEKIPKDQKIKMTCNMGIL